MKKNSFFENCSTYEEMVTRAAECLVWNTEHPLGKRLFTGSEENGYRSDEWRGFCSAFSTLFGDSDFYTLVDEIWAKVKAVGAENYPWSWKK